MPSQEFNETMRLALDLAAKASQQGDIPVGAIVLNSAGVVVGRGFNSREVDNDPMNHAEIVAMREAANANNSWRLDDHTLVVTLEPCTMCAGAILNSRISRLVFGAAEPKTGAAGSVHNVFDNPTLNHHTTVQGNLMADESRQLLQQFFKPKRMNANPLREDALRPLDEWFEGLPDYPWHANYVSDLPALQGLRMHYLDEARNVDGQKQLTYLCLHGNPAWSYLYRKMIPTFTLHGHRVVAQKIASTYV